MEEKQLIFFQKWFSFFSLIFDLEIRFFAFEMEEVDPMKVFDFRILRESSEAETTVGGLVIISDDDFIDGWDEHPVTPTDATAAAADVENGKLKDARTAADGCVGINYLSSFLQLFGYLNFHLW